MAALTNLIDYYPSNTKEWFWVVLGAILLIYCVKVFFTRKKFRKMVDQVVGPIAFPLLGNLREMGLCNASLKQKINPLTVFHDLRQGISLLFESEKMHRVWMMATPVLIVYGAETIEPILTSNVSVNKGTFYKLMEPWLGKGLLTSQGVAWRTKRKALTPTFHFKILQDFIPVMNQHSEILVRKLTRLSEDPWVDIVPLLTYCTLDIISETAMGVKLNCQENVDSEYAKAVHQATFCLSSRGTRPWLWSDFIYNMTSEGKLFQKCVKIIKDLTVKVIKDKKQNNVQEKSDDRKANDTQIDNITRKRLAFLDLLLEKHYEDPTFTEKDMMDEVNTFMFGGHDTTATSLTWILYLLGLHPEIQEKLFEEMSQVLGNKGSKVEVTIDDLRELKYMDMVLKECQRLYPSVPGVARKLEEDVVIGGKLIPKGVDVFLFFYQLHRDKSVFPNPEIFDPERFNAENSKGRHPYAFLPFSAGPRNCIGQKYALMEEKVILCHILLNFKITSLDPRDKVLLSPEVVLRPKDPVRLQFHIRK